MTKEEAVMVQDVDTLPAQRSTFKWYEAIHSGHELPAVRAVVRPDRDVQVTAEAVLVPRIGVHINLAVVRTRPARSSEVMVDNHFLLLIFGGGWVKTEGWRTKKKITQFLIKNNSSGLLER